METVLVTGDMGFIGRHLVSELKKNFSIIGLGRKHEDTDYDTIDFDITSGVPDVKADHIVHLAADVRCDEREKAFGVNVVGTHNMLELAKRNNVKSFVFASTSSVYGFGEKTFKETDKPLPHDIYSQTKYEGELLCKKYSEFFPVAVLRYFFPYGASQKKDRLINRLIDRVKTNQTIELNVDGKPVINPVAMSDAVAATMSSMKLESNFEIINVGGVENVSILEIVKLIEKYTGKSASIKYTKKEVSNMIGDITKAKEILAFQPKVKIEKGIEELSR